MTKLLTGLLLLISFNTFSQQPIFATVSGGDLYSFDLANCTRRFIGATGQPFGDIAFTPDGRLWGTFNGDLFLVDTATANATLVGNYGFVSVSLVSLNDSILLAEAGRKLYGIRTSNATSYYIDSIGHSASGDFTWYDDDLYMVSADDTIFKMVFNSNHTALVSVTALSNPAPVSLGAVTATFVGESNSIVGFSGANLFKICQIDGSSQMLCSNLNLDGTPGAASIRLANQSPQPTTCFQSTVPLILTNFDAKPKYGNVLLQWQTSQEVNTLKFIIEKSKTSYEWTELGYVIASGYSNSLRQYSFVDSVITSSQYYRLRMLDVDGKSTYSKIELVQLKASDKVSFYPNPAGNFIIINNPNSSPITRVTITNSFGGKMLELKGAAINNVDLSRLVRGLYIITIEARRQHYQYKLLKM